MLCRDGEKGKAAKDEISKLINNGKLLRLHSVDVSSPAQIHAFVREFTAKKDVVCDVLVNNAGVMVHKRILTNDGLESNFATNTFGPYCLTEWLLPTMKEGSRVINVVSAGMLTQKLSLDYNCEYLDPFDGTTAYARNKRQLQVLTEHWSRQHPHTRFYAPHPGWADTPGVREAMPGFYEKMQGRLRTVEQGVDTIVWAACSSDVLSCLNGSFLQGIATIIYCMPDRKAVSPHLALAGTKPSDTEVSQFTSELSLLAKEFSQMYSNP